MKKIRSSFLLIIAFSLLLFVSEGCKSSKKASEARARAEREARMAREKDEKQKREEQERLKKEQEEKERARKAQKEPNEKVESYFGKIAGARDDNSANSAISEALNLFASPETPVLIVIHQSGEVKDYDRPTTIKKYLEYLKDQKKSPNAVSNLVFDNAGKIKEVELIKK